MNRHLVVALPSLLATMLAPVPAEAQDASSSTSGNESINAALADPERYLYENGVCPKCVATDVTNTPRAQNLNPEGINYADCEQNLRMDFSLVVSGFSASDDAAIQTWAGTVDCTQPVNRVSGAGTLHACWQVAPFTQAITATASQTVHISVYARDLLRYEQPPTTADGSQPYDPTFASSQAGESACLVQPTDAAVPLSIYFIAVAQPDKTLGIAYQYSLSADLVAPPPPTQSGLSPGDTVLTVNWTAPGTDPDLAGYVVYSDPPAGTAPSSGGCGCGSPGSGSGVTSYVGDGAVATGDAGSGTQCVAADAGDGGIHCSPINTGSCADSNLTGHNIPVGGATDAGVVDVDASTGDAESEAGVSGVLPGGGISQIPTGYQASEIDSVTTTSLMLSGLTNGIKYHVVVASFDGSGNVGPASPLQCQSPGAVNDFWQSYKDDGGGANGCALERSGNTQAGAIAGIGLLAAAAALARRRR